MTFGEAINSVLSKYATFTGRASRAEFWHWVVVFVLLTIITRIVDGALFASSMQEAFYVHDNRPLTSITILALLIPNIALAVRRLHDIGRSGWWMLLMLIPLIGPLVLLYWYVQPSEDGPNQFG
jgi:uncharacterized membrane protein YhaH (DUF805 family)